MYSVKKYLILYICARPWTHSGDSYGYFDQSKIFANYVSLGFKKLSAEFGFPPPQALVKHTQKPRFLFIFFVIGDAIFKETGMDTAVQTM